MELIATSLSVWPVLIELGCLHSRYENCSMTPYVLMNFARSVVGFSEQDVYVVVFAVEVRQFDTVVVREPAGDLVNELGSLFG